MAPIVSSEAMPVGIFVYGTLRNDSGCTSRYSAAFNEGCVSVPATLPAAALFFDAYYPYVMLDEVRQRSLRATRPAAACLHMCKAVPYVLVVLFQAGSGVRGLLVFPSNLGEKVKEADRIEQEGVMYHRCVRGCLACSGSLLRDALGPCLRGCWPVFVPQRGCNGVP